MLLTKEHSLCEKNQSIVVSKDKGTSREHRAVNPGRGYDVRHYKLDGELVKYETCCDFLLINDSTRKAYFIELKGSNIDEAVPQLESAAKRFRSELAGYLFLYRIVTSKVCTHRVNKNSFRKFQEKCGSALKYQNNRLEESLD